MDNEKALDLALGQITKQFGEGAVMKMGEKTAAAGRGWLQLVHERHP